MDEATMRFYNVFTAFMARIPEWFLIGDSLVEFINGRKLSSPIRLMVDKMTQFQFLKACEQISCAAKVDGKDVLMDINGTKVVVCLNENIDPKYIYATPEEIENRKSVSHDLTRSGLWKKEINPEYPYYVQLPYRYGSVMDAYSPGWFRETKCEHNWNGAVFFDEERRKVGAELISLILDCGKRAGIEHAIWLGFGCCLGKVMVNGFIPKDNDIDICIDTDRITKEQEDAYLEEIHKPITVNGKQYPHGLCESRYRDPSRKGSGGRALWTSIGHRSIEFDHGVKACNWFWFRYSGFAWHSKGGRWVNNHKFNHSQYSYRDTDEALALGIPEILVENLIEVDFEGVKVKMPLLSGSCCDWWYPGWDLRGNGSSARKALLIVGKWSEQKTWRVCV